MQNENIVLSYMQVLKEDIRDRILAISLEHFRENYIDRSTELVKAWFASMQQKHPEINTVHSVPQQEMETILHDYILFEIQGWRAIIQI